MALTRRSLGPDGTHGYWKEGDKVNTGGNKGVDYILTGGVWKRAKHQNRPENGDHRLKANNV